MQVFWYAVIATMLTILGAHLVFTVKYHIVHNKPNWIWQMTSVLAAWGSVWISIGVLFSSLQDNAYQWPYMFPYAYLDIPETDTQHIVVWTRGEQIAWEVGNAIVGGLGQGARIQFLTLLFPSSVEGKLFLISLAPLAIASSVLNFTKLSSTGSIKDLGDAARSICDTTLSLLYLLLLLVWALHLNRNRAFKNETGAFATVALMFAGLDTLVCFTTVIIDGTSLDWLKAVEWGVRSWGTWLGWWWFVSAGMWAGEVEDNAERWRRQRRGNNHVDNVDGESSTIRTAQTGSATLEELKKFNWVWKGVERWMGKLGRAHNAAARRKHRDWIRKEEERGRVERQDGIELRDMSVGAGLNGERVRVREDDEGDWVDVDESGERRRKRGRSERDEMRRLQSSGGERWRFGSSSGKMGGMNGNNRPTTMTLTPDPRGSIWRRWRIREVDEF